MSEKPPFRVYAYAGVARVSVWRDAWSAEWFATAEVLDARCEFGPGREAEIRAQAWVRARLAAALAAAEVGP